MTDSQGLTEWRYNFGNRLEELETPQGETHYTYRDNGQRLQMTEVGLGDTDYGYDAYGRLQTVENRFSEVTTYSYDVLGRIDKKEFDSGQYERYGYDSRYRITDVDLKNSSNVVLQDQTYVFDDASRVTSYVKGGVTTTYGYDDANQLTSESRTGHSATYSYDDNGNRLTRAISGGVSETYTYDDDDKLTAVSWGGGGYKSFDYDNAGRMTTYNNNGSTRYFAYDYEGRMTAISGAYTASFEYNGASARVEKIENSITSSYARDGVGVTSPALSDGAAAYTPGTSERRSSTTTYLHSGLKNAEVQSGTGQAKGAERTYDAFGNVTASSGTWKGPFGYAASNGYQEDSSGLKLLGHRYYDPSLGRFLSRDPIKDGRNWYAYCDNNPVSRADGSGLGWHDPVQVHVHPDFKGTVIVIGEPGKGELAGSVVLQPGQESDPRMDVDVIVVMHADGRIEIMCVLGSQTPGGAEVNQEAYVRADGSVAADGLLPESTYWIALGSPSWGELALPAFDNPLDARRPPRRYRPPAGSGRPTPGQAPVRKPGVPRPRPSQIRYD